MANPGSFFWYELMTTDVAAAETFYTNVVGWSVADAPGSGGDYKLFNVGADGVAGLMHVPDSNPAPMWVGTIYTPDVDDAAKHIAANGGTIHRAPFDIPGGWGRMAVAADPDGSVFSIMNPQGPDRDMTTPSPGDVGWRDIAVGDGKRACDFYVATFGWTKGDTIPMGPMGDYQLFHTGAPDAAGGIMAAQDKAARPTWVYYFVVPAIDAARDRIIAGGGTVTMEPMEVPGGAFAMEAIDPQGAKFGLTAAAR